jgi:hypothetical protein
MIKNGVMSGTVKLGVTNQYESYYSSIGGVAGGSVSSAGVGTPTGV